MFTFQFPKLYNANFDELIFTLTFACYYAFLCNIIFSFLFGPVNNIEKLFLIYFSLDLCSVALFYICFVVLISLNSSCSK